MKLPPYITQEQKKVIKQLFHITRQKYGIDEALLLKRMTLVAAYGTADVTKITFTEYLHNLRSHIQLKPMTQFWGFKSKNRIERDTVFNIPYKIVKYAPQNQLEQEIINMYTKLQTKRQLRTI